MSRTRPNIRTPAYKTGSNTGLDSFDLTVWTQPNKSIVKKNLDTERITKGPVSAKTMSEKNLFLLVKITQLIKAGLNFELRG